MGTVVVCIDTSGSCYADQADFLGHLDLILTQCKPEEVYAVYCDAEIERVDKLSASDTIEPKSYGGGGTSFIPPFDWVDEELPVSPAVMVYLTDGYGSFPSEEPDYPVIWAMTTGIKPPFGRTVRVK